MIKPLDKNVLVKKMESKTISGIYMPQSNTNLYEVIRVGKNVTEVKNENTVIIDIAKAKEVTYNSVVYYLVSEENILGVVED